MASGTRIKSNIELPLVHAETGPCLGFDCLFSVGEGPSRRMLSTVSHCNRVEDVSPCKNTDVSTTDYVHLQLVAYFPFLSIMKLFDPGLKSL